jgi:hypothetical protein
MISRFGKPNLCDNLNHRKAEPQVGHCPQCGGVVNNRIRAEPCSDAAHARERRQQTPFCVNCGTQLIFDR